MVSNDDQRVEEIVKRDPSFIPQRFILNEELVAKDVEILLQSPDIPILDLTLLSNDQDEELKELDEACKDWGFFLGPLFRQRQYPSPEKKPNSKYAPISKRGDGSDELGDAK